MRKSGSRPKTRDPISNQEIGSRIFLCFFQPSQKRRLNLRICPFLRQTVAEHDLGNLPFQRAKAAHLCAEEHSEAAVIHGIDARRRQLEVNRAGFLAQLAGSGVKDRFAGLAVAAGKFPCGAVAMAAPDPLAVGFGGDHGEGEVAGVVEGMEICHG